MHSRHSHESEVHEINTTANKQKKNALVVKLRNLGNHKHNIQVLSQGFGELEVIYRPQKCTKYTMASYIPCRFCYGYYGRAEIWRHVRRCQCRPYDVHVQSYAGSIAAGDQILPCDATLPVKKLINGMRRGPIRMIIRNDNIIKSYAAKLLSRTAHNKSHLKYIRARLRELARLLMNIRQTNTYLRDAQLYTVICPKNFDTVVQSVRTIAGYDDIHHEYKAPSLAMKIGYSINRCAILKKNLCQDLDDGDEATRAQNFADRCKSEWNDDLSGAARHNLQTRKFNKPQLLPLTEDIMKMTEYIKERHKLSLRCIRQQEFDQEYRTSYRCLSECILAELIMFNRRRQGEVSKLCIETFKLNCEKENRFPDVVSSLSPLEQHMYNNFTRIEIAGKRNNKVPLLFTNDHKIAVSYLIDKDFRKSAGINCDNNYVFAATSKGSLEHIRGHDVLRHFSKECGAKDPALLRSTKLRKHLATMSQVLSLTESELEQVCNYMGHSIKIHRDYYRLPLDVVQTAKVCKILLALEKGDITTFQGKTLEEIHVGPDDSKFSCYLYIMMCVCVCVCE